MLITIENADKKLLDVIKSIIKLTPNANLKIEKEPTNELLEAIEELKSGKVERFKDFETYKKVMEDK
ncbi:hypothetical protein [Arcobacter porcinus]|uniref:hypothetical protein n=1 Tax=Arcobacter porcinus TaxID=1935204 RepID=UPI0008240772|nr:hypothetical protein [Arcobacter porcinus]OCL81872.1 hypothetical protein AAW30_01754 [Arcobacter porcinus]OCL87181.1 hypothetical protein AAX30_00950 [Arcobacter porcinus]